MSWLWLIPITVCGLYLILLVIIGIVKYLRAIGRVGGQVVASIDEASKEGYKE